MRRAILLATLLCGITANQINAGENERMFLPEDSENDPDTVTMPTFMYELMMTMAKKNQAALKDAVKEWRLVSDQLDLCRIQLDHARQLPMLNTPSDITNNHGLD